MEHYEVQEERFYLDSKQQVASLLTYEYIAISSALFCCL